MKRKWIILAMLLIIPAMLFSVSCAKKAVVAEPAVDTSAEDEAARQAELEKQRALEEERLAAERAAKLKAEAMERDLMMAKNRFLDENVYFDFDSAVLSMTAQDVLKEKAMWLRTNSDASVVIEGHCDERGTNAYNLALGERRADSARSFLINLGIPAARLTTISYGEEKPVDPAHNEEAWTKNRRAAFVLE
ncbi:peptidoglycan-associated lipoprotein Pal [Desulfosarcina ovata]|uniref:Peptidoglycan-associated lipoprotein n=2 Tax=Desulfosarcina ovata TaxID=83564 RepID=A0A5K8AA44_9BACT|nr:peptidoglycan-associated lipoprotein Pal [Desulfosarcina ovata]BBO81655.1 hypothetical protein DSCO28_22210 [Desulfosarcina ovata subsp. sediminis]BBO88890.1 hypothetical protein DSCOOX_20700 [Desulfosarcina ovata subsp. ovata]